jgi:hypothetical protein
MDMSVKPQDVVVALKLRAYPGPRPAMSIVAHELGLSPSEVDGALKRLQESRLLHGSERQDQLNLTALEEFLIHGLKYAFRRNAGKSLAGFQLLTPRNL